MWVGTCERSGEVGATSVARTACTGMEAPVVVSPFLWLSALWAQSFLHMRGTGGAGGNLPLPFEVEGDFRYASLGAD